MNVDPAVSIVTPCLNASRHIETAILNVLNQRVEGIEHIVVDGGSVDDTKEILTRYKHLKWISEPDSGQSDALNKGFKMSRAEIIGWLNSDDTYVENAIRIAMDYLNAHPECDIVYGDCNILRPDGTLLVVFRPPHRSGYEELLGSRIHTPSVFFRRRVFNLIGYLNENLHFVMDNEFWLRAARVATLHYLALPLANFHQQPASKSLAAFKEFGPEMCCVLEGAFRQEPRMSAIPETVKQGALARVFWHSGITLAYCGDMERATPYLRRALDEYHALNSPELVADCLVMSYLDHAPRELAEIESLIDNLPISDRTKHALSRIVGRYYERLRFYSAYNRQCWRETSLAGYKVFRSDPRKALARGFLSLWLKSLLRAI